MGRITLTKENLIEALVDCAAQTYEDSDPAKMDSLREMYRFFINIAVKEESFEVKL